MAPNTKEIVFSPAGQGQFSSQNAPSDFILYVEEGAYIKLRTSGQRAADFPTEKFELAKQAKDGTVLPPDNVELEQTFGTTDKKAITDFMLEHGELRGGLEA